MVKIAALVTTLGLDSSSFVSGLDTARAKSKRATREIEGDFGRMRAGVAGLAGAVAGFASGFVVTGLAGAISQGLEYASSLGEVAQQLGVTTATLQEYRYAATQAGVSQEQMDQGLARLTRSLGMAEQGNKPLIAAFQELGVTARSTDEALPQIVAGLSRIEDPAKRAALEVTIFGKAGQKLDTLLAGGVGKVDELRDAAHRLGIVLSEKSIETADETADKLAAVDMVLKSRVAGVVAENADAIIALGNSFAFAADKALKAGPTIGEFYRRLGANWSAEAERGGLGGSLGRAIEATSRQMQAGQRERVRTAAGESAVRSIAGSDWSRNLNARLGLGPKPKPLTGGALDLSGGGSSRTPRSRPASSGPSLAERAQDVMDRMFPDEAQRRELEEKAKLLGEALRKGVLPKADYERGVLAINAEIAKIGKDKTPLLDRLLPETVRLREVTRDLADLDGLIAASGGKSIELARARVKLVEEETALRQSIADDEKAITGDMLGLDRAGLGNWLGAYTGFVERAAEQNKEVRTSFRDTAESVLASLDDMARGFQSGSLLGGLSGILSMLMQLGDAGLFGAKIRGNIRGPNRQATGGPLTPGRLTLVGERGPELIVPTTQGSVIPSHVLRAANDRGGGGAYFDLRGAVMTDDLLRQMNGIAASTAGGMIRADADRRAFRATRRLA